MIVVAIIGVLAAIAVPNYQRFACRAKQGEAKTTLNAIFVAEESYRSANDAYFSGAETDLVQIGMAFDDISIRRYQYSVAAAPTAYTASATGFGVMDNDHWTLNDQRQLVWVTSGCD